MNTESEGGCLKGCGCLAISGLLLSIALCAGAGIWIYYYGAGYLFNQGVDLARNQLVEGIKQAELPPEEEAKVVAQVDRVADKYKSGEINTEQVMKVFGELGKSPFVSLAQIAVVESKYLTPSTLSEEEKAAGRVTLQRLRQGLFEEKITQLQLTELGDRFFEKGEDDKKIMKDSIPDDELREFLAEANALADEAGVPAEPQNIKVGDAMKEIVDRALAKEDEDEGH